MDKPDAILFSMPTSNTILSRGLKVPAKLPACEQWLRIGMAVHPLLRGSKGWQDQYRGLSLELRLEAAQEDPDTWKRLGVEPGSPKAQYRWVVVDDDSHKDKYTDEQRTLVRRALWELFRAKSTNPQATGQEQDERLFRALKTIPAIETPSGGRHYFFRYDGPSFGAMNLPGLDILCETNVATWPTEGYRVAQQFMKLKDSFSVDRPTLEEVARILKPLMAGSVEGSVDDIRARGRNNYARNLLWRTCMAALRVHTDSDRAKDAARDAWREQVEALSATLGGEDPSEWGVDPEKDFLRTWDKAAGSYQRMTDMGVLFDDGYLQALCRNKEGFASQVPLIGQPMASIRNEIILAGPPSHRAASGVRIEGMDGASHFIDRTKMGTSQAMASALSPFQIRRLKDAVFQPEYEPFQAVADGLLLAADGTNLVMPTGVWWRREFTPDLVELIPTTEWAFYADEVILPDGTVDPRVACTPIMAHQVMQATGITNHVPWKLGPDCSRERVAGFLRTLAGFAQDDVAARAVVLAGIGIMRGWLRGSSRVGSSQPFISIEGPTGAGKTTGIFTAVLALAGVSSASGFKTQAMYSTEMTQSRCATLVLDDQDIRSEWGELLRIQQVEGAWSKTNSMRHLLGTTVMVSQGLPILENDQALQDRVFRIDVPEVMNRRSLLDPDVLQERDLPMISRDKAAAVQGGWTRAIIEAMGMVDVNEAVEHVWRHWSGRQRLSPRQRLVMASAELAARIYCWVAIGMPPVDWWAIRPKDLAIKLDDGSMFNIVQVLRDTAEESILSREAASPLAMALAEYFQKTPFADWDRNGEPKDHIGWCKQFPAWMKNGRIAVRVGLLSRWAMQQRWPDGIRTQLFSVKQFHSEMDMLHSSGKQYKPKYGVQFRNLTEEATSSILSKSLEWTVDDLEEHLELK